MNFKELKVWQKSKDLAIQVYKLTDQGKMARDFGLRDQMIGNKRGHRLFFSKSM